MELRSTPIIDVIIPVYNQWPITLSCLISIFSSKNSSSFEIIVVNDASTDPKVADGLKQLSSDGKIIVITNPQNLGFIKSVNAGMRLHRDRDVLLLNNDTLVFGDWLDRLRRAAYSHPKVATANPLTNSSHISSYPFHGHLYGKQYEIYDQELDTLAAEVNKHKTSTVHTTVGFCMYIRRDALNSVGLFDEEHFPYAYGEESDFCYRSRSVGWRHVVAGDVFVRHLEGQSFGERRARLVSEAVEIFRKLHPEYDERDREFALTDPNRQMRINLDLGRLKLLLKGDTELPCSYGYYEQKAPINKPILHFSCGFNMARFILSSETFPNLPAFNLPDEIAWFNTVLARLGVTSLRFSDQVTASHFEQAMQGRPFEVGLDVKVTFSFDFFRSAISAL